MLVRDGNLIVQPTFQMVEHERKKKRKWINRVKLCGDYFFYYNGHLITIESDFKFDGATIPRFLWGILGICPFGWVLPAALKHDYIYVNEGKLINGIVISREWCDTEFINDLLELELINKNFVPIYRFALRIGGLYYWKEIY